MIDCVIIGLARFIFRTNACQNVLNRSLALREYFYYAIQNQLNNLMLFFEI